MRTHHLAGKLQVKLINGFHFSFLKEPTLFLFKAGNYVPYQISSYAFLGKKDTYTLKLKGVDNQISAKKLTNYNLFAKQQDLVTRPLAAEKEISFFLLGYQVTDQKNKLIGKVSGIEELKHQKILFFDSIEADEELPLNQSMINRIDHKKREVNASLGEDYWLAFSKKN